MPWASTTDFSRAVQNPAESLADEELRRGEVARNQRGLPMLWAGNFASVYRIHCPATGKTWALKCFTREVGARQERYRHIAAALEVARLPFTVPFYYLDRGIQVNGQWFPAVKLEWVEGQTLNSFVEDSLEKPKLLRQLLDLWPKLVARLRAAGIAHADLQHGNVLLVPSADGKLAVKLIDYDGMYVPALTGTQSGEVGHPNYQHPQRARKNAYNADIDRFCHLAIYCAVDSLVVGKRDLWQRFNNDENILFREQDFQSPERSELFRTLWETGDANARTLVGRLALACRGPLEAAPWLDEIVEEGRAKALNRDEQQAVAKLMEGRKAGDSQQEPLPEAVPVVEIEEVISIADAQEAILVEEVEEVIPAEEVIKTQSCAANRPAGELAAIAGLATRSPGGVAPHRPKKKKNRSSAWLVPTIAGTGVAAILAIAFVIIYLNSTADPGPLPDSGASVTAASPTDSKKPDSGTPVTASAPTDGRKPDIAAAERPKGPVLRIHWPEGQRRGASLFVNAEQREVPTTGPIELAIPPKNEQYSIRLLRKGFQEKSFTIAYHEEDVDYLVDEWESAGIGWKQDFEMAKQTALSEHKNVLILFDASDSSESSFASGRFRDAVAKRKEFQDRADKECFCVYIDNPRNAETQEQVKDLDRNRALTEKFGVTVFPTVVVTDPSGRPFGVLEGYKLNGIIPFLELMDKWETDRKRLSELLAKIDGLPEGSVDPDVAAEVLDFLELNKLDRFYRATVKNLIGRLPADGRPVTKEAGEIWMATFTRAQKNPDEVKKVVDDFDRWKKTRVFKNRNLAAQIHLAAAWLLFYGNRKGAAEKCKEALAFNPQDPQVRAELEQLSGLFQSEKVQEPAH